MPYKKYLLSFYILICILIISLAGSGFTAEMTGLIVNSNDIMKGKIFTKEQVNTLHIGAVALVKNDCVFINLKNLYDIQPNRILLIVNKKNTVITSVRVEIYNSSARSSQVFARVLSPQAISEIKEGLYVIDENFSGIETKRISTAQKSAPTETNSSKGISFKNNIIAPAPEVTIFQENKTAPSKTKVKEKQVKYDKPVKYEFTEEREAAPKVSESYARTESLKTEVANEKISSREYKDEVIDYYEAPIKSPTAPVLAPASEKSMPLKAVYSSGSGLKAGYSDDNKQFNYFIDYLNKFQNVEHYPINIGERIIIKAKDLSGNTLPNTEINIFSNGNLLSNGLTYSDGSFMFFPSEYTDIHRQYKAVISFMRVKKEITFERSGKREIIVKLDYQKSVKENVPVDILFIFDVTGSMQEEIDRLKASIELIKLNIASISSKPELRFGMVLFRDIGDEFVTKIIPLTKDMNIFQEELNKVKTAGGGDGPEDLQSALKDAIHKIDWNKDGIRLSFIITDAPPHLDYRQTYSYVSAAMDAKDKGIKIYSVGTGGLDPMGEYILRQLSQYTSAKYIFLTYGEKGESEGGMPGSVSHHTGSNYETDKLEAIIIKIAKEEISSFTDQPVNEGEDYFIASKIESEKKEETLKKLFDMATSQLIDYSTYNFEEKTPAAVLSINAKDTSQKTNAEYFTEQLTLSLTKNKKFKMVERKDLQSLAKELELSLAGFTDEKNAVKVGQFIGAKILVYGDMYAKDDNFEMFLKLVRVETGEILSITKLKINSNLGV